MKLDGREYMARDVSAPAVIAAHLKMQKATPVQERAILTGLLRLAFPWRPSMIWLGDPVKLMDELPPEAWKKVITSFFAYVTGNPVTPETVMGQSPPISLSERLSESPAEDSPPTL